MRWTAAQVAAEVNGKIIGADPDVVIDRVTQDSRDIAPNSSTLFVAIVADRDGHDFIPAAVDAGAVAYLTTQPAAVSTATAIVVDDTGSALSALGRAARRRLDGAAVIAVTGSVGKTTTKDLLAAVLGEGLRTHANTRSFNNEIGVPLTLLGCPDDAEAVVIEMGSRGAGDITILCDIASPTIGVVTAVGAAHTSEFGDLAGVVRAKTELIEALPEGGLAVLNADIAEVAGMDRTAEATGASVLTFGMETAPDSEPDVRATEITLDDLLTPSFTLVSEWGSVAVTLGARGIHLVSNALAAAAVGLHLGLTLERVAAGLAAPVMSPLRMELLRLPGRIAVVNDCYNANPMSMEAALRSLAALPAERRVAVLGVMAELGDLSQTEHARIGALAAELDISVVALNAPEYGGDQASSIDEALDLLKGHGPKGQGIKPDTAVLVKGSRVAGLERLVAQLQSDHH